MTFEEIKGSKKTFLVPKDVAPILGVCPYNLNLQAKDDISKLGFPAMMVGSRLKIPKYTFIQFCETVLGLT